MAWCLNTGGWTVDHGKATWR